MTARPLAALVFVICFGLPAQGLGQGDLKPGPTVTIASIVDGDTVVLKTPVMGATQIRLVGIQAPKLPLGRKNFPAWPLAEAAKSLLTTLIDGQALTLSFGGAKKDRHGRLLAHLHRRDLDPRRTAEARHGQGVQFSRQPDQSRRYAGPGTGGKKC